MPQSNRTMIINNIYKDVLIDPVKNDCNELYIVSGYSSATFLRHHFNEIIKINPETKINLIIGMKSQKHDHAGFINLINKHQGLIDGHYYNGGGTVHSKVYSWVKDNSPLFGFSGSANYSRQAFLENQENQMVEDDPSQIKDYFIELAESSINMKEYVPTDKDFVDLIDVMNVSGSIGAGTVHWIKENETVQISHLTKKGGIAEGSGLNWGHRKDGTKRNKDQAELRIRSNANKEGFLPEKKLTFTLLTDDGKSFDCKVSQTGRKAITSTNSNAELGLYFRNRLGLESGAFITKDDLLRYGRTDFILKKLDPETFYLDFRKTN